MLPEPSPLALARSGSILGWQSPGAASGCHAASMGSAHSWAPGFQGITYNEVAAGEHGWREGTY